MYNLFVKGINVAVIGALATFMDKYPVLLTVLNKSKHPSSDWDFFMTVAGAGSYLLTNKVGQDTFKEILRQLSELDSQMPEGLNNFFSFMEERKNEDNNTEAEIGFWVLWNVKGNPPAHDESKELAPAIGNFLFNVIKDLSHT